jgi:hypothetical protein
MCFPTEIKKSLLLQRKGEDGVEAQDFSEATLIVTRRRIIESVADFSAPSTKRGLQIMTTGVGWVEKEKTTQKNLTKEKMAEKPPMNARMNGGECSETCRRSRSRFYESPFRLKKLFLQIFILELQ